MHKLVFAGALALALAGSLSGCANGVNGAVGGINALTGALSSPAANQAAANLKAGAQAVVCDLSQAANIGAELAQAVSAKQAVIKDAQTAYVVTTLLCTSLGGSSLGTAIVPASTAGS